MLREISTTNGLQRSLRLCLSTMAALLYQQGHSLEAVSVPHKGLDSEAIDALNKTSPEWQHCQGVLESSDAITFNDQDRLVLTPLGRGLLFDMFGKGAADCA